MFFVFILLCVGCLSFANFSNEFNNVNSKNNVVDGLGNTVRYNYRWVKKWRDRYTVNETNKGDTVLKSDEMVYSTTNSSPYVQNMQEEYEYLVYIELTYGSKIGANVQAITVESSFECTVGGSFKKTIILPVTVQPWQTVSVFKADAVTTYSYSSKKQVQRWCLRFPGGFKYRNEGKSTTTTNYVDYQASHYTFVG